MGLNKGKISRLLALKKLQELYQVLDKKAMQERMKLDMKYKQYLIFKNFTKRQFITHI